MNIWTVAHSVHGSSQARILEWVAISFSRGSSWPRDRTCVSCTGRRILYHWGTREARIIYLVLLSFKKHNFHPVCLFQGYLFSFAYYWCYWALPYTVFFMRLLWHFTIWYPVSLIAFYFSNKCLVILASLLLWINFRTILLNFLKALIRYVSGGCVLSIC